MLRQEKTRHQSLLSSCLQVGRCLTVLQSRYFLLAPGQQPNGPSLNVLLQQVDYIKSHTFSNPTVVLLLADCHQPTYSSLSTVLSPADGHQLSYSSLTAVLLPASGQQLTYSSLASVPSPTGGHQHTYLSLAAILLPACGQGRLT
jgi:hypothetical protein